MGYGAHISQRGTAAGGAEYTGKFLGPGYPSTTIYHSIIPGSVAPMLYVDTGRADQGATPGAVTVTASAKYGGVTLATETLYASDAGGVASIDRTGGMFVFPTAHHVDEIVVTASGTGGTSFGMAVYSTRVEADIPAAIQGTQGQVPSQVTAAVHGFGDWHGEAGSSGEGMFTGVVLAETPYKADGGVCVNKPPDVVKAILCGLWLDPTTGPAPFKNGSFWRHSRLGLDTASFDAHRTATAEMRLGFAIHDPSSIGAIVDPILRQSKSVLVVDGGKIGWETYAPTNTMAATFTPANSAVMSATRTVPQYSGVKVYYGLKRSGMSPSGPSTSPQDYASCVWIDGSSSSPADAPRQATAAIAEKRLGKVTLEIFCSHWRNYWYADESRAEIAAAAKELLIYYFEREVAQQTCLTLRCPWDFRALPLLSWVRVHSDMVPTTGTAGMGTMTGIVRRRTIDPMAGTVDLEVRGAYTLTGWNRPLWNVGLWPEAI